MHCFYIDPPIEGVAELPSDEAKHAAKVLRLRPGDGVCAMDGRGRRWAAEVTSVSGGRVALRLGETLSDNEAPVRLTVYQGVPKADKLELIVQKLTELGASALVPVQMERCVAKLEAKEGAKRQERLMRISREAAKQCRRAAPLEVAPPADWQAAHRRMEQHDLLLVPWEEAASRRLKDAWAQRPDARDIGIVIGSEGGMSPREVEALQALGAAPVTLGPRILRTETAALAAAAVVMSLWGDV